MSGEAAARGDALTSEWVEIEEGEAAGFTVDTTGMEKETVCAVDEPVTAAAVGTDEGEEEEAEA